MSKKFSIGKFVVEFTDLEWEGLRATGGLPYFPESGVSEDAWHGAWRQALTPASVVPASSRYLSLRELLSKSCKDCGAVGEGRIHVAGTPLPYGVPQGVYCKSCNMRHGLIRTARVHNVLGCSLPVPPMSEQVTRLRALMQVHKQGDAPVSGTCLIESDSITDAAAYLLIPIYAALQNQVGVLWLNTTECTDAKRAFKDKDAESAGAWKAAEKAGILIITLEYGDDCDAAFALAKKRANTTILIRTGIETCLKTDSFDLKSRINRIDTFVKSIPSARIIHTQPLI